MPNNPVFTPWATPTGPSVTDNWNLRYLSIHASFFPHVIAGITNASKTLLVTIEVRYDRRAVVFFDFEGVPCRKHFSALLIILLFFTTKPSGKICSLRKLPRQGSPFRAVSNDPLFFQVPWKSKAFVHVTRSFNPILL